MFAGAWTVLATTSAIAAANRAASVEDGVCALALPVVDAPAAAFPVTAASAPAARTSIRASRSEALDMVMTGAAFACRALNPVGCIGAALLDGEEAGWVGVCARNESVGEGAAGEAVSTGDPGLAGSDDDGFAMAVAEPCNAAAAPESRAYATEETSSVLGVSLVFCWAGMSFADMASKMFPEISFCCPAVFPESLAIVLIICCSRTARARTSWVAVPGGAFAGGDSAFAIDLVSDDRILSISLCESFPASICCREALTLCEIAFTTDERGVPFCTRAASVESGSLCGDAAGALGADGLNVFRTFAKAPVPNSDASDDANQSVPLVPKMLLTALAPFGDACAAKGSTD